jgi:hypothetical protein
MAAPRSLLPPTTEGTTWARPFLVALATVPTFVLGFETYAIGAFVLFGLLALLHTPGWVQPRSWTAWGCAGLAVASGTLFFAVGASGVGAPLDTVAYGAMVAVWATTIAGVLGRAGLGACLLVGAGVWVTTTLLPPGWGPLGAAAVFLSWLVWHVWAAGRAVWRTPDGAVRMAFLCAYGVFLTAFAAAYTTVGLGGAAGATGALEGAEVVCGTLVPDCATFTALATRATLVETFTNALARNHAGSASVAGLFMILASSWIGARHRTAGRSPRPRSVHPKVTVEQQA